jgi:hypothetical protein
MKARRIQLGMKKYNQTRDKSIHLELTPHELRNLIMNSDPNNIHENDFIPHDCYLCGERIESIHDSHNPFPLVDSNPLAKDENGKDKPKRCCNDCNELKVIPARIESRVNGTHKDGWNMRKKMYGIA